MTLPELIETAYIESPEGRAVAQRIAERSAAQTARYDACEPELPISAESFKAALFLFGVGVAGLVIAVIAAIVAWRMTR